MNPISSVVARAGDIRMLAEVLKDPGVREKLMQDGLEPMPGTRADLARYIDRETEKWSKVVRDAKIQPE